MSQFDKFSHALAQLPTPAAPQPADEWLDLRALFRVVRRRIFLVLIVAAAVLASSLPSILQMKKVYSASSRLLIFDPSATGIAISASRPEDRLNMTTEVERLLSQGMAVRVVEHLSLENRAEFNPALREPDLKSQLKSSLRDFVLGPSDVVGPEEPDLNPVIMEFRDRLTVFRFGNSDVVSIGFLSEDPQLAAAVPNTLLQLYLEDRRAAFDFEVSEETNWYDARLRDQKLEVDAALRAVEDYRDAPEFTSPEALGVRQSIASLAQRRSEVDRGIEMLQLKLDALVDTDTPQETAKTVDNDQVLNLSREYMAQENELASLRTAFGENHAKVIEARTRLSGLRTALRIEILAYREGLARDLALLEAENKQILEQTETARSVLSMVNGYEAELGRLQRVAQSEQDALLSLENRRDALLIDSERPFLEAEVLSPASVPDYPVGRGKSFYAVVALIASVMLGLSAAFVREMFDNSVRSHDQLRRIPGLTAVGMVPKTSRAAIRLISESGARHSNSVYSDAIRGLALALETAANGKPVRSLAVLSAVPGEGSSTLAAALAFELSTGRKVFLVDCDVKRGSVHQRMGVDPAPGLSDLLAGSCTLDEVIRTDSKTGMRFLTRGSGEAGAILNRAALQSIVQAASDAGETVIFDGAPALATSSAAMLAGVVERTLLVTRWGKTGQEVVAAAVQRIGGFSGVEILSVINRVNLRRQALYGYRDAGTVAKTLRKYYARRA